MTQPATLTLRQDLMDEQAKRSETWTLLSAGAPTTGGNYWGYMVGGLVEWLRERDGQYGELRHLTIGEMADLLEDTEETPL